MSLSLKTAAETNLQVIKKLFPNVVTSYIDGKYLKINSDRKFFDVINPSTAESFCQVQSANDEDLAYAVESANQGFRVWSKFSGSLRSEILHKASQIIKNEKISSMLAHLETTDNGKTLFESLNSDIPAGADSLEYFSHLCTSIRGDFFSGMTNGDSRSQNSSYAYTVREPLGVCGGIGAWNYPFLIACWKAGPALAAGNSLIYKPSEWTPLSALKLAEIFREAGLPNGVFNVIQGGGELGKLMSSHSHIQKMSFTGSVSTGVDIMNRASPTLKSLTLELGGKSPLIVFPDCDPETAINSILMANYCSQGQVCTNGSRVFLHEDIHDEFVSQLVARVKKISVGNPLDPRTNMGAIIHEPHLLSILDHINTAVKEGAHIAAGGNRFQSSTFECRNGFFVEPTILINCSDDMTCVRQEIFGPVMSILKFKTEQEVISRANNSPYGLAAGILTRDLKIAYRVSSQIQAGMIWVNNYNISPSLLPFGGFKMSGIGKENGIEALQQYLKTKSVYVEMEKSESIF